MNVIALDFDSWNKVDSALNLLAQGINEDFFRRLNSMAMKRSFCKQLNESFQYINLWGGHFHIRILLGQDLLYYHTNSSLEQKIEKWNSDQLIKNTYDILGLIGFEILEVAQRQIGTLEEFMDKLEADILINPDKTQQTDIIKLHRQTIKLNKKLNDFFPIFNRNNQKTPVWEELIINFQSELDNSRQLVELMENIREAYQAAMDNKANDIMKYLTVLATIFLPINILTSFFGMNFQNMPLIHLSYGVNILYILLLIIIAAIIIVFKRKKWF